MKSYSFESDHNYGSNIKNNSGDTNGDVQYNNYG